jgi:poly(3-hydroxybutyrate) depolymerase
MRIFARTLFAFVVFSASCSGLAAHSAEATTEPAPQERQCMAKGWKRLTVEAAGLQRQLLWKAPEGKWPKGTILILHGGGGQHFQWCVANAPVVASQVRFSEMAVAEGFAVFLLNSSDRVTDREGRPCGKVWDDEVRDRRNLDLPFIGTVIRDIVPKLRPAQSGQAVFLTGLSSGGYMTARAGTHFDDLVTAFAPVSSGDPYGWHRICKAGANARTAVHGGGFDNETGRQITEVDACRADSYPNERAWDGAKAKVKPAFRVYRHHEDGVNDQSCNEKIGRLLRRNGYRGEPDFVIRGGERSLANHLWLDAYHRPILDFFASQVQPASNPRNSGD